MQETKYSWNIGIIQFHEFFNFTNFSISDEQEDDDEAVQDVHGVPGGGTGNGSGEAALEELRAKHFRELQELQLMHQRQLDEKMKKLKFPNNNQQQQTGNTVS